jgi:hypothetical protein
MNKPDKHILRHGRITFQAKALDAGPHGTLEGYAATFDNVDQYGEVFRRGAFAKTIRERIAAGMVPLMSRHLLFGGDVSDVIGTVKSAVEDAHGLSIIAEFSADDAAQAIREKIVGGHVRGLSVGYNTINSSIGYIDGKEVLELFEVRLAEVTVTPFPVNEQALITAAKAVSNVSSLIGRDAPITDRDALMQAIHELRRATDALQTAAKSETGDSAVAPLPTPDDGAGFHAEELELARCTLVLASLHVTGAPYAYDDEGIGGAP